MLSLGCALDVLGPARVEVLSQLGDLNFRGWEVHPNTNTAN